jgi:hypothetical protein
MTNTQKELTPEEARELGIKVARKTLEDKVLQSVLGSNQILKNQALYGQLAAGGAEKTYDEIMNSKKIKEIRDNLYKEKKERGDALGVYGEPSINNYDVAAEIIEQLGQSKLRLPLKDLGEVVKSIAKNYNYDFEVPKELGDYVPSELQEKIQRAAIKAAQEGKKIKPEDALNAKEKDAFNVYQLLSQAYNRGVSLKTCNYFADLNELGKEIMEKYKPKESKGEQKIK